MRFIKLLLGHILSARGKGGFSNALLQGVLLRGLRRNPLGLVGTILLQKALTAACLAWTWRPGGRRGWPGSPECCGSSRFLPGGAAQNRRKADVPRSGAGFRDNFSQKAFARFQLAERAEFIGPMGLLDRARTADDGRNTVALEMPGLGAIGHGFHLVGAGQLARQLDRR
jgi:hypothetical protein